MRANSHSAKVKALNYGEINKHATVLPHMNVLREFLEWLGEQKIELGTPSPTGRWLTHYTENREEMLARFFEIDTMKLENERRALLESCK